MVAEFIDQSTYDRTIGYYKQNGFFDKVGAKDKKHGKQKAKNQFTPLIEEQEVLYIPKEKKR